MSRPPAAGAGAAGRVELRTRRPLWRLCAAVWPRRSTSRTPRLWSPMILFWCLLATIVIVANAAALLGLAALVAAPAVLLALLLLRTAVLLGSLAWYSTGAGHPVLIAGDGEVRGRLRPVWADQVGAAGDPGWWDLRLPAADLLGVRIARPDRSPRRQLLALDLPTQVAQALSQAPPLRELSRRRERSAGTPAAWNAGAMLPFGRRAAGLRDLAAAIERARLAGRQHR